MLEANGLRRWTQRAKPGLGTSGWGLQPPEGSRNDFPINSGGKIFSDKRFVWQKCVFPPQEFLSQSAIEFPKIWAGAPLVRALPNNGRLGVFDPRCTAVPSRVYVGAIDLYTPWLPSSSAPWYLVEQHTLVTLW